MRSQNHIENDRKRMKVLAAISMAAAATLAANAAHGATLSLYYGNDPDYSNSNNAIIVGTGYDPDSGNTNNLGGTQWFSTETNIAVSETSATTITVPVGSYLSLAIDALLTGNSNPAGGNNKGPNHQVQPSYLGLSSLSVGVSSTDATAQFLTPIISANPSLSGPVGKFGGKNTYSDSSSINNNSSGYAQGSNGGGGYNVIPSWAITGQADIQPNEPGYDAPSGNGSVGLNFYDSAVNVGPPNSTQSTGVQELEQFAASNNSASYNNATDYLDSLIFQGLSPGVVTLSPYVVTAGSSYWTNTSSNPTGSLAQTYGVHIFSSSDTVNNTPVLVIDVVGSGPANLTWNDAGGNNIWDTATSSNWNSGAATTVFHALDNVTFNDNNGSATGRYSVTLNTTVSPGSVTVNNSGGNYTIGGAGSIGGTGSLTKSGTGTLTLSTPNTYTGGTNVSNGRLLIDPTSSTTSALPTGALSVSGGTVQLADNVTAGTALGHSNVTVTSLSITGTGALDIGNNRIIIDYSSPATDPIASIEGWIKNGYLGTPGPQIISSDISADDALSGLSYGIGYADGADGVVAGLPSGEIEIMYTLLGDANLDGTVNSEDFSPFSHNLGQSGMMWDDGDFNYDGTVNSEDFSPFSHNLGQTASLAAAAGVLEGANGISLANVPEPISGGLMAMAGSGILLRRRRSSRRPKPGI
jgi:autotransporter-associated beta strand protein